MEFRQNCVSRGRKYIFVHISIETVTTESSMKVGMKDLQLVECDLC